MFPCMFLYTVSPFAAGVLHTWNKRNIFGAPVDPELKQSQLEPLSVPCAMLSCFSTANRVIQQSNTDTASVLHLTLVWEAITLAQTRQLYLIYKLPALSPSQTGTAGALFIQSVGAGMSRGIWLYLEPWKTWQGAKFKLVPICTSTV